jgi:hypothetical protein
MHNNNKMRGGPTKITLTLATKRNSNNSRSSISNHSKPIRIMTTGKNTINIQRNTPSKPSSNITKIKAIKTTIIISSHNSSQ